MVYWPKIFKGAADALKGSLAAAVAFVQAHPVATCVTVVVVVGVTVYVYYTKDSDHKEKDKEGDLLISVNHSSGQSKSNLKNTNQYVYDPVTKSIIDAGASTTSDDNIKKGKVTRLASTATKKINSETLGDMTSSATVSKEVHIETSADNLNNDDSKVLLGDIPDGGMSAEEKVNEYLHKNNYEPHVPEILSENSNLSSGSNSTNQAYVFLDLSIDGRSGSSVGTFLTGNSDWCKACEEKPANAYVQPCNHYYMCGDCATKIVKLFKKCKICGVRIEAISVQVS